MFEQSSNGTMKDKLEIRLEQRDAVVGVMGLGYVGLPLATAFAHVGFRVIGFDVDGEHVLILGVAYKRNISDARESPALDIIKELQERYAHVAYADAFVPTLHLEHTLLHATPLTDEVLQTADCVIIVTDHSDIDYANVVEQSHLVIDTRNVTRHYAGVSNVWRLKRPTAVPSSFDTPAHTYTGRFS